MKNSTKTFAIAAALLFFTAQLSLPGQVGNVTLLWSKNCQKCHGKDGRGNTKAGKMAKAKDFTDADYQEAMEEETMHKNIKEGMKIDGKTKMKPFAEKLTDEEITALIVFVRKFGE